MNRWDRFWHHPVPTLNLALFRIAFSICLYREVSTSLVKSRFALEGGFHLPYLQWIPLMSEETYVLVHLLQYPLIALLGLGVLHRFAAAGLLGLQGWIFFSDALNFRNHPYFFLLLLLLLILAPASETLSFDAWRRLRALRRAEPEAGKTQRRAAFFGRELPRTAQRLIQVQFSLVYFYAAIHKLNPAYLGGDILAHQWSKLIARQPQLEFLMEPGFTVTAAYLSVITELGLALLLWPKATRRWAMLVGVAFHLAIGFTMNIYTFSWAMIGGYLLFLDPQAILRRFR